MISDSALAPEFWATGRCQSCPVIDMHGHMGAWSGIQFPRASTAAMIHTMDQCGVRLLVFCHHAALFCPDIGNAASIAAVRQFPDRLRAYLAINPNYPDTIARELASYDDHRDVFVGLKILADYHGARWDAAAYEPAWRFAEERGLLVLAHTWSGSADDGAEMVRTIARRYGKIRLLLGHSLHPDWNQAVAIAREFPHVYLELTAVLDDRGPLEQFVGAGLPDRLLFGTDLPWFDPHQGIGAVLSAEITDEDRHSILHRNAAHLLQRAGVPAIILQSSGLNGSKERLAGRSPSNDGPGGRASPRAVD